MKKTIKRNVVVSSILAIMLCVSLIAGSTFALFTSESKVNIAVTSGKVSVVANIDETSVQTKQLYDTEYEDGKDNMYEGVATFNAEGLTLEKFVPGDGIKFNIVVKNESTVSVYVALGHNFAEVEAKEAFCVNAGNAAYSKCKRCALISFAVSLSAAKVCHSAPSITGMSSLST